MYTEDAAKFSEIMAYLGELYDKPITKALNEIYWLALARFELQDVKRAVIQHINNPDTGQFMPKPADIVRSIEGDTQTQAMLAWSKVDKAIRQIGPYESVVFDDPIIHAVIENLGGWIKLGEIDEHEIKFLANQFEKRYRGYIRNPPLDYPRQLIGIANHQNNLRNQKSKEPIFLGNQQKAKQLFHNRQADNKQLVQKAVLATGLIS